MKKSILGICFFLSSSAIHAQNGLENIIVEKYYVSDANDAVANADGGVLPVGSVTYRIYADMLPGYKFQAVYGVPGHEMRIETSTLFFNNEDRGATAPTFTRNQAANNTVMLDSWLSVGAACTNNFGILKADDDGVSTIMNGYTPQVLQNNDPAAGIPLTTQDGVITVAGRVPEPVTFVGITTEAAVFDNQNDGTNGPLFSSDNGSWASLNGSVGPDSIDNKVLIAQITTDGIFSFMLNIQIGTPAGGVENYVAQAPVANEIQLAALTYSSITGVDHPYADDASFSIFPNPASNHIRLHIYQDHLSGNNAYSIHTMQGEKVLSGSLGTIAGTSTQEVDLPGIAKGLYILELSRDGITTSKKLVIQ